MIAVTSSALWHKVVLLKSTTKCFEIWAPKMERKGCWTSEKIQSQVGWGSGSQWFSSLGQRSLALSEPPLSCGLLKGEPGDSESMFSLLFFSLAHGCRQEFG